MEEQMPSMQEQFEAACQILRTLRQAGHQALLAGGCVRDLLLDLEPKDFDVATSAPPEVVLRLFPRTFAVGAKFGVVLVATCGGADSADAGPCDTPDSPSANATREEEKYVVTEVATFRADGAYSDGRRPDEVRYTQTAAEDVQRRDFTINGLLLDPLRGGSTLDEYLADPAALRSAVLDHVGGLADLDARLLRAIGRPEARFEEDHLRMLRAVRFAARYNLAIEDKTLAAIRALAPKIALISRERVRDELTRMLTGGRARRAFELLASTGLLAHILPEVAAMQGVEQPPQFHPEGDVWEHTLRLLGQLEPGCPMTLAWAALLHDVGKPPTFRRAPDRIRFDSHAEVGAAMAAEICRRFRFSNAEKDLTVAMVAGHMRFMDVEKMRSSTLKRLLRQPDFDQHLALHRMDCLAGSGFLQHWEFLNAKRTELPEEEVRPAPLVTGRELIAAGYRPGPAFRPILQAVEEAQLEGEIRTPEEAMRLVLERFPTR
jgi:poly(A) polymerase